MRFIVLLLVGLLITKVSSGQSDIPLVFEGCENADNQESCSLLKLADIISNELSDIDLPYEVYGTTLTLTVKLAFCKNGKTNQFWSIIYDAKYDKYLEFESILTKIPITLTADASINENPIGSFTGYFSFQKSNDGFKTVKISNEASEDLKVESKVPVYNGCKAKWDNEKIVKCNSNQMASYISSRFKAKNLDASFYVKGETIRGKVDFFIEADGSISISKIDALDLSFEKEIERLIKAFDGVISPGYLGPKPIRVPQFLPIVVKY